MNSTALRRVGIALVLATVAVAASAQRARVAPPSLPAVPPPILVTVVDGAIQVSDTALAVSADATQLSWTIGTPGYRFTSSSINFGQAQAYFSCSVAKFGLVINCAKSSQAPKGSIAYRISLSDGQSGAPPVESQVFIQND